MNKKNNLSLKNIVAPEKKEHKIFIPRNAYKHLDNERQELPQIPNDKLDDFIRYLEQQKIIVKKVTVKPSLLKPAQKHINKEKVQFFISKEGKKDLIKPVIISKEGYIIDGHHRWLAWFSLYRNKPIHALFIKCSINKIIEIANDYKGSFNKAIDEIKLGNIK